MKKSDFSQMIEKAKVDTSKSVGKAKEETNSFAKAVKDKVKKTTESFEKKENHSEKAEPKVKLDDSLRIAVDQYNAAYTTMNDNGATLHRERIRAVDLIVHVEDLVNSIANRPKEFDTEIEEIRTQKESFIGVCEFAKAELETAKKSAIGVGAGMATGAAIASVAPTAAMWVATTFGTASTGTAISTLSGAAATNAALAWLGGGALTAGGGGMAAGHALLALAGPVGWGIAGVTLLSSIVLISVKKLKTSKKKKEEIERVKNNTATAKSVASQIQEMVDEVTELRDRLSYQYNACLAEYGKNFTMIPMEQQMRLGALVNNTKALSASLSKSIQ